MRSAADFVGLSMSFRRRWAAFSFRLWLDARARPRVVVTAFVALLRTAVASASSSVDRRA